MAKFLAIFSSAICFFALAGSVQSQAAGDSFTVEGKVYCDPCRVQFETKLSESLPGAKVKLECKDADNGKVTYTVDGVTDSAGNYKLKVEGDHQMDICAVTAMESPRDDCKEVTDDQSARVVCTSNSGIHNEAQTRFANPISFMASQARPECNAALKEIGYIPGHQQ